MFWGVPRQVLRHVRGRRVDTSGGMTGLRPPSLMAVVRSSREGPITSTQHITAKGLAPLLLTAATSSSLRLLVSI